MKSMKLLIDANILLDVLTNREPHVRASSVIWKLCETNRVQGYVSALTFANIVYVMRKELSPERIEDTLRKMSLIFEFVGLDADDLMRAAALKWDDFEDALQSVTALRVHADHIITRNVCDFAASKISAVTPTELIRNHYS